MRGGFDMLWLVVFASASSAWCLTAAPHLSATFDEPLYVESSVQFWETGSHRPLLRAGTLPLGFDVQSAPLAAVAAWTGEPWSSTEDFRTLLTTMRAGNLVFWWLLLGYVLLIGHDLAGPWAGRLAVAVLACEPNFLAHATLATADLAVSAGLLAFLYHAQRGREANWRWRVALPGVVFGVAMALKASALAFGPLALLAIELHRLAGTGRLIAGLRTFLVDSVQIGMIGLGTLVLLCGSDWQPEPSFVAWAEKLPAGTGRDMMLWLSQHLCIFSNGLEALARQVKHNMHGHGMYLLGQSHPAAVWYYFPVLFTIKLTAAWLIGLALVVVLKPRGLLTWAGVAAGVLLLYSLNCRVQIGIRLMLPVLALVAVALSAAAVRGVRELTQPAARWLGTAGVAALVGWSAWTSATIWPQGLQHINPFWGGVVGGERWVSDSNYDWGQGLIDLDGWHAEQGRPPLAVWYFGTDPMYADMPVDRLLPHLMPTACRADVEPMFRGRLVAAATTLVQGHALTQGHQEAAIFLREHRPVARTATFLIYDFRAVP